MFIKCGLTIFLLIIIPLIKSGYVKDFRAGGNRLNPYISHHERLNYDAAQIHASHSRAKRSITKDPYVFLNFNAFGRDFNIRIKRDINTFSDNLVIDSSKGEINVDSSHIYKGEVVGDKNSYVFGSVIDGVFEGKVITSRDSFYIEKAKHYFPNRTYYEDEDFHSVIYNENHVEDPHEHLREGHVGGCGINDEVLQWMDQIQNSDPDPDNKRSTNPPNSNSLKNKTKVKLKTKPLISDDDFKFPFEKYTKEANWKNNGSSKSMNNDNNDEDEIDQEEWEHEQSHERVKRAARMKEELNKNTCSLYIQTDPLIWRHIREGIADHDRGKKTDIDEKTREEILSLIAHHVTAVNYIYRNTKFDGRVEHRNIRFEVQRIKIDDDSACGDSFNGDANPFCMENIDVSNFLNLHSLGNHEIFCLAYVFTYRDFTGGTLGLAWVASASGASGGICEKYKTYTETVSGLYQSTKRSLNTGIITFVNYNSRVPPKVSQLTLAHEIGHNFGSPHDYPSECRPGGLTGNYIMFASATSGDRPNNSKFSTCSIRNISNVLDAIEDSKKRNCFKVSEGAFCGNKIVESGEECDCGFNDEECLDRCCYPRVISEQDLSRNATAKGCTRRARTQCSPSQGPCCLSETCEFVPAHHHSKCKEETECSWSATCNGTTPECPEPKPRDDKTKCNNGTQLCIKGECSGSICLLWNMSECFLTSTLIPNIDKRKLCELACQNGTDTASCRSTSEFARQFNLPVGGISLRPGAPCDNFQGYCDVFLKCRAVDAEGPLARLKNKLFDRRTLETVQQWITENWYAVVFMGICFVIIMGIFIKCCAVYTPSSNPKKPPARRISDTLRGPMNTLRRMRNHHHHGGAGPRSIPPPNERSRSGGGRGDRNAANSGPSVPIQNGRRPPSGRPQASGLRGGTSGGPSHGYGEGRGGQYYPPKATAPQLQNYSRMNHPELYAEAYPARSSCEYPPRQPNNNKV